MLNLPDSVRQDIVKLVPSSILNELCCFVFYDHHPLDTKKVDITVCTSRGEVKEYFQRDAVFSFRLDPPSAPREIKILRNSKNELFYLLSLESETVILSRTNTIQVHRSIKNVESCDIYDDACRGQAYLKVICKDDAVPQVFDDNFESLSDAALVLSQLRSCDTLPAIMLDLTRKLSEAKYNVKCFEKSYCELTKLRQNLAFSSYKKLHLNVQDSLYRHENLVEGPLKLKTQVPVVKFCNKKVIIIVEVLNKFNVSVENIHVLLHRTAKSSVVYKTKLFEEKLDRMPYWKEMATKCLNSNCKTAVVASIDRKELKNSVSSRVVFSAVISYTMNDKEYLLPLEDVTISAMDTMGENCDVWSKKPMDSAEDRYSVLSILASSQKIDLSLTLIRKDNEFEVTTDNAKPDLKAEDVFSQYLGMEFLQCTHVLIHRSSPYHILHGVIVILEDKVDRDLHKISVYARSSCQVLAMIQYIHNAVPQRAIVTTPNQKITSITDNPFINYVEDNRKSTSHTSLIDYGASVLNQSMIVLDYLDQCMVRMNESKNPAVQVKVGREIDVLADNVSGFLDFKHRLMQEVVKAYSDFFSRIESSEVSLSRRSPINGSQSKLTTKVSGT